MDRLKIPWVVRAAPGLRVLMVDLPTILAMCPVRPISDDVSVRILPVHVRILPRDRFRLIPRRFFILLRGHLIHPPLMFENTRKLDFRQGGLYIVARCKTAINPGQPPRTGPVPARRGSAHTPARRLDEIKKEPRHSARLRIIKKRPVKRAQKGQSNLYDILSSTLSYRHGFQLTLSPL